MTPVWLVLGGVLLLGGLACAHQPAAGTSPPVLTDASSVDARVGQLVTLRGVVTRTKVPTILGVDVDASYDLADRVGEATGVLERVVVTQAEIDERIARSGQYAHRGPGTTYLLRAPDGAGLAVARGVP